MKKIGSCCIFLKKIQHFIYLLLELWYLTEKTRPSIWQDMHILELLLSQHPHIFNSCQGPAYLSRLKYKGEGGGGHSEAVQYGCRHTLYMLHSKCAAL